DAHDPLVVSEHNLPADRISLSRPSRYTERKAPHGYKVLAHSRQIRSRLGQRPGRDRVKTGRIELAADQFACEQRGRFRSRVRRARGHEDESKVLAWERLSVIARDRDEAFGLSR